MKNCAVKCKGFTVVSLHIRPITCMLLIIVDPQILHCVQKKNTHSHFLSYLHELFLDLNKNCSEYTQGSIDSDNVKIIYLLRSMT